MANPCRLVNPAAVQDEDGDVKLSVDLVPYVLQLTVLLNAVDCFPNGGLYDGVYATEAARRYERVWLPLLAKCKTAEEVQSMVPPLDVAWAWLVHRLNPVAYARDLITVYGQSFYDRLMCAQLAPRFTAVFGPIKSKLSKGALPGPFAFTDARANTDRKGPYAEFINATLQAWTDRRLATGAHTVEPFFPPRPLADLELQYGQKAFSSNLSIYLPAAMTRQAAFLHSLLRPCYLERPFLEAAQQRYLRFLILHRENPEMTLVPMMDIDLLWHTHMGLAAVYREDMLRLFDGNLFNHDDSIVETRRLQAFDQTRLAYEARFPEAGPYNPPPTQLVPIAVRHPLEQVLGPLTQLFWSPANRKPLDPMDTHMAPSSDTPPATTSSCSSPTSSSSPAAISPSAAPPPDDMHVGGHAVYLGWLLARVAGEVMASWWLQLFNSKDQLKLTAISKAVRQGLGFSQFLNLPLGMSHEYWGQFSIRNSTGWGLTPAPQQLRPHVVQAAQLGPEVSAGGAGRPGSFAPSGPHGSVPDTSVPGGPCGSVPNRPLYTDWDLMTVAHGMAMGVPLGADPSDGGEGDSDDKAAMAPLLKGKVVEGLPYAASGYCPGCGCSMAGCRCAVRGYTPFDMALLPVLVDLAAAAQRKRDGKEHSDQDGDKGGDKGPGAADGGSALYPYPYAYYYPDSLFLTWMTTSPSWGGDVDSAMGGDGVGAGGWMDGGSAGCCDGFGGFGEASAAPCGGGGCGGGGCGGGHCGGGVCGGGGGGGGCGG